MTIRTRRRRICRKLRATKIAMAAEPRSIKTSTSVFLTPRIPFISGWAKTIRLLPRAKNSTGRNRPAVRTKKIPAVRARKNPAARVRMSPAALKRKSPAVRMKMTPAVRARKNLAVLERRFPAARVRTTPAALQYLVARVTLAALRRLAVRKRPAAVCLPRAFLPAAYLRLAIPRAVPRNPLPVLSGS